MRTQAWPNEAENALADEAIRIIPGIALARLEGTDGTLVLTKAYLEEAFKRGITPVRAWQILSVTEMTFVMRLLMDYAENTNTDVREAAQSMALNMDAYTHTDA